VFLFHSRALGIFMVKAGIAVLPVFMPLQVVLRRAQGQDDPDHAGVNCFEVKASTG
jgi:hypothetical protein